MCAKSASYIYRIAKCRVVEEVIFVFDMFNRYGNCSFVCVLLRVPTILAYAICFFFVLKEFEIKLYNQYYLIPTSLTKTQEITVVDCTQI